jgi:single-strand DNA-binding protein
MNQVILIGRLTQDVDLRFSQGSNMSVARFTVAVDKGYGRDKKEQMASQGKPTADFPKVVVFGRRAENCANYVKKGSLIAVKGSIQTGSYTNQQGNKVYTTEVLAERVEFLERANNQQQNQQRVQQHGNSNSQTHQQNQPQQQGQQQTFGDDDFQHFQSLNDDEIPF